VNTAVLIHDPSRGCWLAFNNPCRIYSTSNPAEVLPLLREIEAAVNEHKLHAAGFISYEAAPAFDSALTVRHDPSGFPLLWFGLYQEPTPWHPSAPAPRSTETPPQWTPSISRDDYTKILGRIRQYLFNGETYQVNYTFRLTSPFNQNPLTLFENLVHAQGAHYSAFIDIGNFTICSASPELFFRLDGSHLESRPMKGTMKRGVTPQEDLLNAQILKNSPKDQSENVMIVDMIRNDMGRVSEKGQVTVEQLFKVERYPTVWQMTSTVSASTQASLCEIFTALFPCASITGAPKPRTMALIAREETAPRRIYTGTIGYLAPDRQAQFNVAIRTVLIDKTRHVAEYGVGGGIVWDSVSANEYEECWTKAKVLTESTEEFQLLETLLWTPDKGIFLLERHLKRIEESAEYFGFAICRGKIQNELLALKLDGAHRIRILVSRSGVLTLESYPFDPAAAKTPVRVRLAQKPIDISNRFLYHKTTCRRAYEDAQTSLDDCDDVLLWNPAGELTESTIANLVVECDGELLTPPVSCGLLAGTFRAELLLRGEIKEAVIHLADLPRVRKVFLINSLRKWREAIIVR
jgi:para-aminobenzoate synthetase/4-amino-4-deoxychorismate lyase